ncbi:MAG: MFS transporter [Micromonosporaceae bacterium]|nr:MFS transporter [Micromonosporaceae bacterium]
MSSPAPVPELNPRRWWILGVLCLSLLVVVVDTNVLNVAIPTLIRDFHASSTDIQWFLDAYTIVFAGLLLTAGVLSDRHGRRLGLLIGLVLFGGASLAAAYATGPGQLIAARAGMGVGAAFLMPGTLSILITVFGEEERKKAIAIWSAVLILGALGGPTLGGALLHRFWWGSVFLINVPIALLSILAAVLIIPESRGPANRPDLLGAALSMVAMTSLIWGIITGARDGWSSAPVLAGFAVALAALVAFAIWESRCTYPLMPMQLFRDRIFTGSSVSVILIGFATGGILLALTQQLQFILGYSPLRAGVALAPMVVASIVGNGLSVALDQRIGTRLAITTGLGSIALGCAVLASVGQGDGYLPIAIALALLGAGSGIGGPLVYATLLGRLPQEKAGVGSALNDTILQTGQALSIGVLGTLLTEVYGRSMPDGTVGAARRSIGDALTIAASRNDAGLASAAKEAFLSALSVTALVGAGSSLIAAVTALLVLRSLPKASEQARTRTEAQEQPQAEPVREPVLDASA